MKNKLNLSFDNNTALQGVFSGKSLSDKVCMKIEVSIDMIDSKGVVASITSIEPEEEDAPEEGASKSNSIDNEPVAVIVKGQDDEGDEKPAKDGEMFA